MSTLLVACDQLSRSYGLDGPGAVVALQPTTCTVSPGARIALVGPSGSGKSTLLHLMAGLDDPTSGTISWPAIGERGDLRPGPVAMVFQGPSLMPALTVLENVAFPLVLAGSTDRDARRQAIESLRVLNLGPLADKLPEEISGGQAQRVAVSRALAGRPQLLLADEPTGQLDHRNGEAVIDVLLAAAAHTGAGLVISTHDLTVADRLPERWTMHAGRLQPTEVHA